MVRFKLLFIESFIYQLVTSIIFTLSFLHNSKILSYFKVFYLFKKLYK
ncbi:MAG: hypothetical protein RLZZ28_2114 [Bacteroidota bacterium]